MNSTKTEERDQWRNKILRALEELRPADKAQDLSLLAEEHPDTAGAAE